jgi:hypothetical protein
VYSLGKTNSMSSSWLNHSFFPSATGFLTVRLTINTTVIIHLSIGARAYAIMALKRQVDKRMFKAGERGQ